MARLKIALNILAHVPKSLLDPALKHDSIYVSATYTVVWGKCKFKIFPIHRINRWRRAINNIPGILHIKNINTDMTLPRTLSECSRDMYTLIVRCMNEYYLEH